MKNKELIIYVVLGLIVGFGVVYYFEMKWFYGLLYAEIFVFAIVLGLMVGRKNV